jgi:hypothetical protein
LEMEVSWTFCLGGPQTAILLILASQVSRIIGMSHWCQAGIGNFLNKNQIHTSHKINNS